MAALFEVRDWRVSKFPLRMIARVIFLTYMWAGAIQVLLASEYQRSNEKMTAGGLEYLTLQGFLGTSLSLVIAMVAEFRPEMKGMKIWFNGFFLVIEAMITGLYWGLYHFKTEMILDPESMRLANGVPPLFMDTAGHLMPFIAMVCEFLYSRTAKNHLYEQRLGHLVAIAVFTFSYFAWILYLFREKNNYPYPFLRMMNQASRTAFTVFAMFLGLFLYGLASHAYIKYHASENDLAVDEEEFEEEDDEDDV